MNHNIDMIYFIICNNLSVYRRENSFSDQRFICLMVHRAVTYCVPLHI